MNNNSSGGGGCIGLLFIGGFVLAFIAAYGSLVVAFYIVMVGLGLVISIPVCLVYLVGYGYWRVFVDSHKMQRSWALHSHDQPLLPMPLAWLACL